ncbi:hypothetical protein HK100_001792 [Physocladia obscura]|uniref:Uncharacterized protein n=1 Tax=Physocladia obscura TaxID=109957 RepID=A0AAD5TAT6_9FUNG|nr:hypothetical protein HK100_001792 [Physocladia obscura]
MRLSSLAGVILLLQAGAINANVCTSLNIVDGGFVCASPSAITYCSGRGLQCCQASQNCGYASACASGVPPFAFANGGNSSAVLGNSGLGTSGGTTTGGTTGSRSTGSSARSSVNTTPTSGTSQSVAPTISTTVFPYTPLTPLATSSWIPAAYTPVPGYQTPPAIIISPQTHRVKTYPATRTYHSWHHHLHKLKTTLAAKTHKTYGHHHEYKHLKKHHKTYKHHYRTIATSTRTITSHAVKTVATRSHTTSTKYTFAPHVPSPWMGDNDGLDEAGLPLGAVEGSNQAAEPYLGPDAANFGYNDEVSLDGAAAADLANLQRAGLIN